MRKLILKSVVLFFICYSIPTFNLTTFADSIPTTVSVVPQEDTSTIVNPYMGFAPRANGGPYLQEHSLVFTYMYWDEIEPQKDVYDFKTFEAKNKFSYWKSKDVKIIFRLVADYPGKEAHMDIPQWLYDEINKDGINYDTPYGKGFSPNYENPIFIAEHAKLISKLAERYNNDSSIAWIEVGSVGHWGEWHTYQGSNIKIPFPKEITADQYVKPYVKGFTNKKLLMRRPINIAVDNNMGLFNDGIGNPLQVYRWFLDWVKYGYTSWLTNEKFPAMPNYWKNAPAGGETMINMIQFCSSSLINESLTEIKDLKLTYLKTINLSYSSLSSDVKRNIGKLKNTLGYRFVIDKASYSAKAVAGQAANVTIQISNKGIAPFYYAWPVRLSLTDEAGKVVVSKKANVDIRSIYGSSANLNESLILPATAKTGNYKLSVAIINPETGLSGIKFANVGRAADGSYSIGIIPIRNAQTATSALEKPTPPEATVY